jgi:hypothetical protein
VFDKKNMRCFRQTCENVGYRPKYYSVDIDGESPDFVEDELGKIEGVSKPIIRKIEKDRKMVVGDDYITLMYYLGILAARVPNTRDRFNDQMDNLGKMVLKVSLQGKTPEDIMRIMADKGSPLESIDDAIAMKELASRDAFRMSVDNTYQVDVVFQMATVIADQLIRRKWTVLYRTDNQDAYFVCGDAPVMLMWQDRTYVGVYPPGFGLNGTEVDIPLTRNIVIIGRLEGFSGGESIRARSTQIRMMNGLSISHSSRFIFSYSKDVPILMPDMTKASYKFQI